MKKAYIIIDVNPMFTSPDDPKEKLEDYRYSLTVTNAAGIPVIFHDQRPLKPLPDKLHFSDIVEEDSEITMEFAFGWNKCLEVLQK